ncbi:hypothetical protein BDW02DRAFT_602886 [Decorospora gaudefroyi]|uniref:Uncharacterized protein n=1 Tax=Decorospora gaudefroyi TaxID=184978 RepID=A0A6A5K6H3_9PLEO|nr:hypothetical protein BDW02DRAFT_602886 [Decorospora gaudefroyi]
MATARSYYNALLALSGNPALADARKTLVACMPEQDLKDVVGHGLESGISKAGLEGIVARLLDSIVAEILAEPLQLLPEDVDDIAHSAGGVRGSSDDPIQDTNPLPTENAHQKSLADATTQVNILTSTNSKKRKPQAQLIRPLRQKRAVIEVPDAQEEAPKDETQSDTEAADLVGMSDEEEDSDAEQSSDASSDSTEEEITAEGSTDREISKWEDARRGSFMLNLQRYEPDDANDNDDAGCCTGHVLRKSKLRVERASSEIYVREMEVKVRTGTRRHWYLKEFWQMPTSTVQALTEKFNRDFLTETRDRKTYQDLVGKNKTFRQCIRELLRDGVKIPTTREEEKYFACDGCIAERTLCARILRSYSRIVLAILPLPSDIRNARGLYSMAVWVLE